MWKKMLSQYIAMCKYTIKMIEMITKLMKYLVVHWIWIDCTISITIHVISQKTFGQVFHSNEHKCVEILFGKLRRIMLEAFVLKSILYVYQNTKWNQRKITPKLYKNIPQKT
jgi:hypothetical protein